MKKLIHKLLFCLSLSLPLIGYTQSTPIKTDEILRTVISADGFINKELHQAFWAELTKSDKYETERLIKWANANILAMQEYQQELWESALISYRNRKVVKTESLINLETKLPFALKQSLPFRTGSPEQAKNEAAIDKRLATAMENSKNLLFAASKHTEFRGVNGEIIPIDEEKILHVIKNIEGSVYRLRKLLNKEWRE
jgi:hypothetical protein